MGLSAGKAQTDRGGPVDHKRSGLCGRHVEHMFGVASCMIKLKSESVDDRTAVWVSLAWREAVPCAPAKRKR
jgi:hypothetical protein